MNIIIKQVVLLLLALVMLLTANAQIIIKGSAAAVENKQPLEGISVSVLPSGKTTVTDALGNFKLAAASVLDTVISFSATGFQRLQLSLPGFKLMHNHVELTAHAMELSTVTISAHETNMYKPISRTDIALRGVSNSQEILRIIPGLVIAQHQGGGKAEQIFLRGFDADHGTDFREDADGMPVNMVSHAHGQGFADSHFIIPETIQHADFKKGPYETSKGDFVTTGFIDFNTRNVIDDNLLKLEGGMFNTFRALGMFNLLNRKAAAKQQSWYLASEYRYSDGYFDNPQHFNRFNLFTKYNGRVSAHSWLSVSATTFWSRWNASGQIPERAVSKGLIGYYGALDPFEGGLTYRTNINAQLTSSLANGDVIKNQVYYSNAHFDLHTNFTFFLVDTINGDEIRQREARDMMGYNSSYQHTGSFETLKMVTEAGLNFRTDFTHNSELSHTVDRYTLLNRIKLGDISEASISPYVSETVTLSKHLTLNAGLRFDQFLHGYNNKLATDTTLPGAGTYKASANVLSPKLNLYYHLSDQAQLYLSAGRGFHSNDTRAVVAVHGYQVLPRAYSGDLGMVIKPLPNIIVQAALWYIYLQQEFVYGGDGGDVTFNGRTRRLGFDLSARYQPVKNIYLDMDLNAANGRALDLPAGQNRIPLAPTFTSSGGAAYTMKNGVNASLRYRFVGDRPGNADYTLRAQGYFICDAVLGYTKSKYEIGLVINNLLNTRWREAQFDTITRLKGEPAPVDQMCFTPGTPFAARLTLAIKF